MTQWEKILGGYATGTLTGEERAQLMQAALSDQALFDVLMDEEALRETLADPITRAALLRALEPSAPAPKWWRNPWPWAGLGALAATVALVVLLRPVDAPKPVQMAQNRPAAAAPEPVPSVIETPKHLRVTEPEPGREKMMIAPGGLRDSVAREMARTAEAPAAPAAPATERDESATPARAAAASGQAAPAPAPLNAPAPVLMAKKKEFAERSIAEPLAVTLFYQSEDGAWRPLDLAAAIPAQRPLRLQVTSAQSGLLSLQPPLVEARTLTAGVPADINLSAQPAGTLSLHLGLFPLGPQQLGRVANELRESKSTALSTADAAASGSPSLTREIRLRIE